MVNADIKQLRVDSGQPTQSVDGFIDPKFSGFKPNGSVVENTIFFRAGSMGALIHVIINRMDREILNQVLSTVSNRNTKFNYNVVLI
jgi:hypothetical protein